MSEGQPEHQAPKTIDLSCKGLDRKGSLSALLHRRYIQDGCVLASAATGLNPTATGQAPKLIIARTAQQTHKTESDSGWLAKPTRQVTILSPVPANNTTKGRDATVQGDLLQSTPPQMPYPGLLLQHPTADSSPMWGNALASCSALSPYPVSTLPPPPLLKPHQTYGYRRGAPPITVSAPALDPLYPPFFGQAGTDELFSLARQYGACVDRCTNSEPKHTKQELSTKRRSNPVRKAAAAGLYNFLRASVMSKNTLQMAQEWVHQNGSTAHKSGPLGSTSAPRHSTGRNAKDTAVSRRSMKHSSNARKTMTEGKRSVALHH